MWPELEEGEESNFTVLDHKGDEWVKRKPLHDILTLEQFLLLLQVPDSNRYK